MQHRSSMLNVKMPVPPDAHDVIALQVNLSNAHPKVLLDDYHINGEWHISETTMHTDIFEYDCCPSLIFRSDRFSGRCSGRCAVDRQP